MYGRTPQADLDESTRRISESFGVFEAALAQRPYLAGESFSLADLALYPHIAQFQALGIGIPAAVEDWLARLAARPAIRKTIPEIRPVATMGPEGGRWG